MTLTKDVKTITYTKKKQNLFVLDFIILEKVIIVRNANNTSKYIHINS